MQATMRIPVAFVREYLPEALALPLGDRHIIHVQLVYLPAYASDISPETPAVKVEELLDGVIVRKDKGRADCAAYSLSGLPLTGSQAASEGYWVRGKLGCNRRYV